MPQRLPPPSGRTTAADLFRYVQQQLASDFVGILQCCRANIHLVEREVATDFAFRQSSYFEGQLQHSHELLLLHLLGLGIGVGAHVSCSVWVNWVGRSIFSVMPLPPAV